MSEQERKELIKLEKKNKKEKSLLQTIWNIILWIIVVTWMGICVTDYLRTQENKNPMFCLKKETIKYNNGNVYLCTGIGYKIYNYDRSNIKGTEFGPFWLKEN